jgi:hypothetical protein
VTTHYHPPGTPQPWEPGRDGPFLIDGCPRCEEYVAAEGIWFDEGRWRAFWLHMLDVETDQHRGYGSRLDKLLGEKLWHVALGLQRAFGLTTGQLGSLDLLNFELRVREESQIPMIPRAAAEQLARHRAALERIAAGGATFPEQIARDALEAAG